MDLNSNFEKQTLLLEKKPRILKNQREPRLCIASLARYSRIVDRNTARPSPNRE
jgi:hypothetical protein